MEFLFYTSAMKRRNSSLISIFQQSRKKGPGRQFGRRYCMV
jgi:hypothetical protein